MMRLSMCKDFTLLHMCQVGIAVRGKVLILYLLNIHTVHSVAERRLLMHQTLELSQCFYTESVHLKLLRSLASGHFVQSSAPTFS